MAKKKKKPTPVVHEWKEFVGNVGVGLDLDVKTCTTRDGSHSFQKIDSHWVVLAIHPVRGTEVYGPFTDRGDAQTFVDEDSQYYSTSRHMQWYTVPLEIPGQYIKGDS